jgi:hypothetical protein
MRKTYPSDVSDEEWAFVAPYLTLMTEEAPQRDHSLREVFNGLRRMIRTGARMDGEGNSLSGTGEREGKIPPASG